MREAVVAVLLCFVIGAGGRWVEALRAVRAAPLPLVQGAGTVITIVDALPITQYFLVILIFLELVLILIDHGLRRVLAGALSLIPIRFAALAQVIHRAASCLRVGSVTVLIILVVVSVAVEVVLLL